MINNNIIKQMVVVSMMDGTQHPPISSTTKVNKHKVSPPYIVPVNVKQKQLAPLKQEAIIVSKGPVYLFFDE